MTGRFKFAVSGKKLLGIGAVLVIVGVAAGLFYQHQRSAGHQTTSGKIDYSHASPADNSVIEQRKDQPPTPSPTQAATASIAVQITGANVQSGNVHIGTLINGATAGNCVLTASKAGQATLQLGSSQVRLSVGDYGCGVFNVPTSAFPVSGTWQLMLNVANGESKGAGSYDVTIP